MRAGEIVRKLVFLPALLAAATLCEAQTADPAVNITAVVTRRRGHRFLRSGL